MFDPLKLTLFLAIFFSLVFVLLTWAGALVTGSWKKGLIMTALSYALVFVVVAVVILGVAWAYDFDWVAFYG